MRIGFIGIGTMGWPMAANLVRWADARDHLCPARDNTEAFLAWSRRAR